MENNMVAPRFRTIFFDIFLLILQISIGNISSFDLAAPTFTIEPPYQVEFYNTNGAEIPCSAHGRPSPYISWVRRVDAVVEDIPGLRHLRPNGSLVFMPFGPEDYRQDIHASIYKCVASNIVGTIGSRDVHVRAVLSQQYEVRVYDEFVIRDNTAVLKCHIPSFVRDYVTTTAWFRDDGLVIHVDGTQGGKYSVFPSGKLHIREAKQQDGFRSYRCQTKHRLTGETKQSSAGQLIVTESHSTVPPRITHREEEVKVQLGEIAFLPCAAEAYPVPTHRWYKQESGRTNAIVSSQRVFLMGGTLVFRRAIVMDSGKYVCLVNNSVGQERIETELIVVVPIQVRVSPAQQTISVGQATHFNCTVSGFPIYGVTWTKNLRPVLTNERIRVLGNDVLSINSVVRDDRGVYQCFAHNHFDSAQGSGALLLGDEPPVLEEIFSDKIVYPGVSVSLKCMATGSPLPQVTWRLDSLPLPEQLRFRVGDYVTRDSRVVSYVNITSIQVEDGGLFSCKATNEVGSVTHAARINVFGPPTIRSMPNVTALAGEITVLPCPAGGHPLSSISWSRDSRVLPQNHRQQVFPNGTLIIREVNKKADEGKYTCTAENKDGDRSQKDVYVQVMVGPKIEPFNFPTNLEEGMRSIVTCAVLSGDPPMTTQWLKDGAEIPLDLEPKIEMIDEYTTYLKFTAVGPHHNGNYTCIAKNPAATVNYTALLVVNVPPYWRSQPTDRSAVMGESLTIDCQANGFPVPQVRWKKDHGLSGRNEYRTIISNPHIQTLENGSLVITEVELSDAGLYMCQATNGISPSLSAVIKLTVHVPAHFRVKFQSSTVRKGETVHLICTAYGETPITLVWTKDRQIFNIRTESRYSEVQKDHEDGVASEVTIISADRRDSALFTCTASNEYGRDETNFQVVVQERPDSPRNMEIKELTSRTVTLTWVQPYSGNLPLTRYIVQLKRQDEQWLEQTKSLTVPVTESSTVLGDLMPVTTYNIRILAENSLGQSKPSEPITVTTKEEAPAAPPADIRAEATSSSSVKVSWMAPPKEMRRGSIKGYYLGYKVLRSADTFTYKTLESSGDVREEHHLTNLRRFTQYVIRLQAFNKAGSGPHSEEITVQTLEYDPPGTPTLRVASVAATSVKLEWTAPDSTPIQGYILHYREDKGEWSEHRLPPDITNHVLQPLRCGTRYQVQITSFNKAGEGEPSDAIQVKTEGTAPVAPDKHSFLIINSTFVTLRLDAWHSGGCPISYFEVKYKLLSEAEWFLVSNNVLPETGKLLLSELTPGTWYNLMISAQNDAGATDAEFVFATLTLFGGTVAPQTPVNTDRRFFKHLSIIVPVVCAVVIVIVVTIVICVLHTRRNPPNRGRGHYDQGDGQSRVSHKGDTLNMSVLGKKGHGETAYEVPKDSLYFPSPYATTRVPGYVVEEGSECDSLRSSTRTPSDPQGSHTYDVPFPVRRPEYEEQYSQIKRVPLSTLQTSNVYQAPRKVL
ncbi:cell adhesion molecule Dscam2-like isoform X4 [Argiope bruennichi]|uniref:cell adhesion molecule Dscam2-like isoform X4 n=1 Tax=Argiope bruennichi TaxID=94029 RepID=UPI0024949DE7|nr:cell adhesion molecule Dscam2-like isoform X4 [Argiope bruennichi]